MKNSSFYAKFIAFILPLIVFGSVYSQDTKSSIGGGAGMNYNIHNTDIKGINGFEDCCDKYSGGTGFSPNFNMFYEYNLGQIFGFNSTYNISLLYNNLSAEFEEIRYEGNLINETGFDQLFVSYQLNPNISIFSIENSLDFNIVENFRLGIGLGISFLANANFNSQEIAIRPDNFTFENGERVRNKNNGNINESNNMLFNLVLRSSYDLLKFDNFIIRPELNGRWFVNNFIEGDKWNIFQISGMLNIVYNIPKNITEPIEPPYPMDMPIPEIPPALPYVNLNLEIFKDENVLIENNSNLNYKIKKDTYLNSISFLNIMFFEKNSTDFINENLLLQGKEINNYENELLRLTLKKLNDETSNLTIVSYKLDDEDANISKSRIEKIKNYFLQNGIDEGRLKSSIKDTDKYWRYNELKDEFRKVELILDTEAEILSMEELDRVDYDLKPLKLKTEYSIDANNEYSGKLKIFLNEEPYKIYDIDELDDSRIISELSEIINNEKLYESEFALDYSLFVNAGGIENSKNRRVYISPDIFEEKHINYIEYDGKKFNQRILVFFEFDKAEILSIDNKVVEEVKRAIKNGREVRFIASTDNLGLKDYNYELARKRAETATKLFEMKGNSNILIGEEYKFNNKHPFGRILNRSVIVQIETD